MFAFIKLKSVLLGFAALAMIAVLGISTYFTGAYAVFYGNTPRLVPIYCVEKEEKVVSLSFDCAWGVDYTDKILEYLEKADVRATFFMVEFWAEKYPEYVEKIHKRNEIGTHSATHSYMSKLNAEAIKSELTTSSEAIESITGKRLNCSARHTGTMTTSLSRRLRNSAIIPFNGTLTVWIGRICRLLI